MFTNITVNFKFINYKTLFNYVQSINYLTIKNVFLIYKGVTFRGLLCKRVHLFNKFEDHWSKAIICFQMYNIITPGYFVVHVTWISYLHFSVLKCVEHFLNLLLQCVTSFFKILFSSPSLSFSGSSSGSSIIWKITESPFNSRVRKQKAHKSSCVANMSGIQKQSYRTTFCRLWFMQNNNRKSTKRKTWA